MGIHVALEHRTTYRYDRPVRLGPHVVRLRPAPHCRTPILSYSLHVSPREHFVNWQQDPFGNHLARFVFPEPTTCLDVRVDLVADLAVINPFDFFVEEHAQHYPFTYDPALAHDLGPYLRPQAPGPELDRFVERVRHELCPGTPTTVDLLVAVNQLVQRSVEYSVRLEPGVQTPDETLARRVGSCRDSGWLLVETLRALGITARFASGYLVQLTPDEPPLEGPPGPDADFTDLHAWAEAFVPGAGWIGLDPTSGLFAGEGHLPLACTPSPSTAAPIDGLVDPAEVVFSHENRVRRIREDPRPTRPYGEEVWARIDALGRRLDEALAAGDVRLTMGGEPTFVSIDDYEAPEWTTAADGPEKRRIAGLLARRLGERFAPHGRGALIQHGQGKWYPGEPLPRWEIRVAWRTDGLPIWRDPALAGDPAEPGGSSEDGWRAFTAALAAQLGIDAAYVHPAFEDPLALLAAEAALPLGDPIPDLGGIAGPDDPALGDATGRAALTARIDAGHGRPAAFVVPLHWDVPADPDRPPGWATSRWRTRRGALYLIPGDSPAGLRLPLTSLSWTAPPGLTERSPFEPSALEPGGDGPAAEEGTAPPARVVDVASAPRTALVTELRHGHVCVFVPPFPDVAVALRAVAAIEAAAARSGVPVVVEGYPLPRDPAVAQLVIAPDPGVIEVNIHPAHSWSELVEVTSGLAADARAVRLGTETFGLDGRHSGTGGGSHITVGGPTPADSPLLRRPELLASMVTYWQHHPSLSYLFSGRFIGPTSQAPRVDEARHDSLYELEIAIAELDRQRTYDNGEERPAPPWLVDRLFRHLLVDVTGNTHRAEFCIDKLYSPDSERGRLGLLELRGFEMAPHPQMALVQALLVRALIARLWDEPYRRPFVRWGTALHDRFLLPWFCRADAMQVVADLRAHGIAFDASWLDPFFEFRFPLIGEVTVGGVGLELRSAIEPWHVLGEEPAGGATARYVDSSVERLQVLVRGLVPGRHAVCVNRVLVPLRAQGGDCAVAGVRYRAWQPPSALHPTIPVDSPLVFDVVDLWNGRSLGGATYHVVHPGGRAFDRFPVNAAEAEARRQHRFVPRGHTPGPFVPVRLDDRGGALGDDYPLTVDLRRAARPGASG